ncbi:MAG: NAD(P)H-binding protein [Myxococcota bacterium]
MMSPTPSNPFPTHVAVIGAAGGLGQGILRVCRAEGIGFTAVVRSRPERVSDVPPGSRIETVTSLADRDGLVRAFSGADAVLTAMGVTKTSNDPSALLSANFDHVEAAMKAANVDRIVLINTVVAPAPGESPGLFVRLFSHVPGTVGAGARELRAVSESLGRGAFGSLRWTLVRAAVNAKGKDEPPVASAKRDRRRTTMMPVSFDALARWMLLEAIANRYVRAAPVVTRRR